MLDAKRYLRLQPKGLTGFVKKNEDYYLTFKRFSVDEGKEIEPEEQLIDIPAIKAKQEELMSEQKGLELILKDLDSFKE
jgi:hypothetical protein